MMFYVFTSLSVLRLLEVTDPTKQEWCNEDTTGTGFGRLCTWPHNLITGGPEFRTSFNV